MSAVIASLRGVERYDGPCHRVVAGGPLPDLDGLRVAVLGDPVALVDVVPRLVGGPCLVKVFHRHPTWVLPLTPPDDIRSPGGWGRLGAVVDTVRELVGGRQPEEPVDEVARAGRDHLRREVTDPWVRRQLTPSPHRRDVPVVRSDAFYAALQGEGCQLVTWPVAELSPVGVRTADGLEHHVDAIVLVDAPTV